MHTVRNNTAIDVDLYLLAGEPILLGMLPSAGSAEFELRVPPAVIQNGIRIMAQESGGVRIAVSDFIRASSGQCVEVSIESDRAGMRAVARVTPPASSPQSPARRALQRTV